MASRGVIYVHSAPSAVCPHVEWALAGVLGAIDRSSSGSASRLAPARYRTEVSWTGERAPERRLASALRGWSHVRYEITEDPSPDQSKAPRTPTRPTSASTTR